MIVSCNPAPGLSPKAYALTLTEQELRDLREALSASLLTVTRNEIESATRRANLMMRFTTALNQAK